MTTLREGKCKGPHQRQVPIATSSDAHPLRGVRLTSTALGLVFRDGPQAEAVVRVGEADLFDKSESIQHYEKGLRRRTE